MLRNLSLVAVLLLGVIAWRANSANRAVPVGQSFDEWAETFTKEWARTSPQLALRTPYISGEEQHALRQEAAVIDVVTAHSQKVTPSPVKVTRARVGPKQRVFTPPRPDSPDPFHAIRVTYAHALTEIWVTDESRFYHVVVWRQVSVAVLARRGFGASNADCADDTDYFAEAANVIS